MKNSKLLSILLCCAMLLSLIAGCAPAQTEEPAPTEAQEQPTAAPTEEPQAAALYTAGTYTGTSTGMHGEVAVEVEVSDSAILSVNVVSENETWTIGSKIPTSPIECYPALIVENQSLNLDTVTGATITSAAVIAAVSDAIAQAGGDVDALKAAAPVSTAAASDPEYTCDVVVAGAGGAGLMAAITAANAGANVILVEKAGVLSGETTRCGGQIMAAGTPYRPDCTTDDLYGFIMEVAKEGPYPVNSFKLREYVDQSADMLAYLESIGVVFENVQMIQEGVVDYPVVYAASDSNPDGEVDLKPYMMTSGMYYTYPLFEEAQRVGVKILFNTPMTEILTEDGKVTGIRCENGDVTTTVKAGSVVLCTGGYGGNTELVAQTKYLQEGHYNNYACSLNDGAPIFEAQRIGAKIRYNLDDPLLGACENFSAIPKEFSWSLGVTPAGERFCNEYDYFVMYNKPLFEKGYCYFYMLFDEDYPLAEAQEVIKTNTALASGSVEEVASQLGMDASVLQATIDRYNELCAKGVDDDFGKDPSWMVPVGEKGETIYVTELKFAICSSFGGMYTDNDFRVIDTDGNVIPNLYAAGTCAFSDVVNMNYPGCGHAIGLVTYMGRKAGATAAADLGFSK